MLNIAEYECVLYVDGVAVRSESIRATSERKARRKALHRWTGGTGVSVGWSLADIVAEEIVTDDDRSYGPRR